MPSFDGSTHSEERLFKETSKNHKGDKASMNHKSRDKKHRGICERCEKPLSDEELAFSKKHFYKPLCRKHQPTPQAWRLGSLLRKRGWFIEYEKFDGYKHIDIAIVEAKVNIEVDGVHHHIDPEQALADLKRAYYSFRKGFLTLRIPNILVSNEEVIEETAEFIDKFLRESEMQLSEEEYEEFF